MSQDLQNLRRALVRLAVGCLDLIRAADVGILKDVISFGLPPCLSTSTYPCKDAASVVRPLLDHLEDELGDFNVGFGDFQVEDTVACGEVELDRDVLAVAGKSQRCQAQCRQEDASRHVGPRLLDLA